MPDDTRTVPVTFDVDPDTAAALQDPATRARVGRLLSRLVQPNGAERLAASLEALDDDASRRGLLDASAHRLKGHTEAERAEADDLVARFRAFAAQHTLGGLDIKELISEGRR